MACLRDDLDALLAIHRVPVWHRIRVRTKNLAERSFVEERRRAKVIGRFSDERSAMKLAFATMIRAAVRWCRVSITDPRTPPAETAARRTRTRRQQTTTTAEPIDANESPLINRPPHLQDAQDLPGAVGKMSRLGRD